MKKAVKFLTLIIVCSFTLMFFNSVALKADTDETDTTEKSTEESTEDSSDDISEDDISLDE